MTIPSKPATQALRTLEALVHEIAPEFRIHSAAPVTLITADSREIVPGSIFVAVRGGAVDGHAHVRDAAKKGALAVVVECDVEDMGLPRVRVADTRYALARLASAFEGFPTRSLKVIGITGTSGKTTTTYLIEALLASAGERVGVIGTVNFRFGAKTYPSTHTTPGAPELQRLLREMKEDGCTAVVMEVSSHALRQHRVAGCAFDAMVFTNLSREHLDFHPDMEDYFAAKAMLFRELVEGARRDGKDPAVVINQDDDWGRKLQKLHLADPARAFSYSIRMPTADIAISLAGTRLRVDGMELFSPLVGEFNASNLMAAVTLGRALGLGAEQISRGLAALKGVPGRLERVPVPGDRFAVFVDYAHKPDALEKVLTTLREIVRGSGNGRLVTVFGCGGDRDRGKRPLMGAISERLSDVTWITSDNPRTEMPQAIIDEVLAGLSLELKGNASKVHVEMDRARAIEGAIHDAREGDVILIAGKGHEDYQLLLDPSSGGVGPKRSIKVPFDDRKVAASAIAMVRKC